MTRRLVLSYVAVAFFVLLILEIPLALNFRTAELDRLVNDVASDALVTAALVEESLEDGGLVTLPSSVLAFAVENGSRILVTDERGISVADTSDADVPRDYSTREEVATALSGTRASGRRFSTTLDEEIVFVAVPVRHDGSVSGAVRITFPTRIVRARVTRQWTLLGVVALVVLAATALVARSVARWATRPVQVLGEAVAAFAGGDLDARADLQEGPAELVELGARIDDMSRRIGGLMSVQRGFAADASHQLRTPLTGLRLELENLESRAVDPEVRAGVERSLDAARRMGRIVDGLLTLARLEGRRPELEVVAVDLVAVEAVETWTALADEAGVGLRLVGRDRESFAAHGVAAYVEQVLDVLVDNALAVTPAGAEVRVVLAQQGDRVIVTVEDDGPGLAPEDRSRAFERRWQGDVASGGTGLGLAIAARMAEASRAELRLEEAASGGLAAHLLLRRA